MNSLNIQQTQQARQGGATAGSSPERASEAGKLDGLRIQRAEDPQSILADAAEELGFSVDNTREFALAERKVKEGKNHSFIERVRLYREIMQDAWRKKDLASLYAFLKNNRSAEACLARLREWTGNDLTETWALLGQAASDLDGEAPAEALFAIRAAMDELERREGPRIRAGIVGVVEGASSPELGDAAIQGANYRQAACDLHDQPEKMFDFIREKYGMDAFEAGLDFLFRSLASDLASDVPSHGTTHLEAVARSLGQARILNGAHTQAIRLIDRWERVHGVRDAPLSAPGLLKEMLRLKEERYLSAASLAPILTCAHAPDIEHEVLFAQELLTTARNLSPLFFGDPESRMRFIDAAQECVDQAIAREDEWLAAQG
jgi:type III secretion protein W